MSKKAKLSIVGAGPGDVELITLKGLKAIQQADVILYDALISEELLKEAKAACKLVYVGKRSGRHTLPQEEINRLIVFYAYRYGHVARLKGGDPFVFGRGHEELEYAQKRGIEVTVIPGITSAISAPASVGIPLTKRGVNESFWVITGTLSNGSISADIQHAARSTATVAILMGMSHLQEILNIFCELRCTNEPAAIIQHATLPHQKFVKGTVANLYQVAQMHQITAPAVIIIGKVVNEAMEANQQAIGALVELAG